MEEPIDEEPKIDFGNIKNHIAEYLKNRLEYFKLSAVEYSAKVAQSIIFVMIITVVLLVFWLFANITAAIAIDNATGNKGTGFLVVSLFNLLLAIFIMLARKALIFKPVSNWIVKILIKSLDADENN